jgi:hypothetical protein
MANKDIQVALAQIKRKAMEWPGLISQKQLAKLLRNGFIAPCLEESPGEFTIFMFRPSGFPAAHLSKEEYNSVRSLLGETKLDADLIRFYAENEFFIAQSTSQLKNQLTMASLTLQLLTREESIGLDGFRFLLDSIRKHRKKFERMFKEYPLLGARIGYQIDTTFQTFCLEMTKYVNDRYPLDGARRDLRGSMEDEYDDIVREVPRGYRLNLILPPALSESQGSTHEDDQPRAKKDLGKRGAADGDSKTQPAWHSTNPNPQEAWGLPTGKKFSDFFDTKDPACKDNLTGWPKFPHHHLKDTVRPMCLHYQTQGKCLKGGKCFMAHVNPNLMDASPKDAVRSKFKELYRWPQPSPQSPPWSVAASTTRPQQGHEKEQQQ